MSSLMFCRQPQTVSSRRSWFKVLETKRLIRRCSSQKKKKKGISDSQILLFFSNVFSTHGHFLQLFVFQAPATASVAMGRIQQLGKRRDVSRGLSRQTSFDVVRFLSWYLRVDPWSLQTAAQVAWVGTQNVLTVRDVCMVHHFLLVSL